MIRKSRVIPNAIINLAASICPEIKDSKIELRVDEDNAEEILYFLLKQNRNKKYLHIKKFARILREVALGNYNDDLYGREPPKGKNVTSMKFTGSDNYRIGCKEIFCKNKKVIMVILFHKKSTKGSNISKKDLSKYKAIGGYEYEC